MILRYADVILMKAEALNELNDLDGAVTELNKIRTRARNGDGTGPWVETGFPENLTTALGQDGLRDAILYERTIELAFEGHRWFDLARTNRLISTLQSQGKAIQEKHKLFPIPDSQNKVERYTDRTESRLVSQGQYSGASGIINLPLNIVFKPCFTICKGNTGMYNNLPWPSDIVLYIRRGWFWK